MRHEVQLLDNQFEYFKSFQHVWSETFSGVFYNFQKLRGGYPMRKTCDWIPGDCKPKIRQNGTQITNTDGKL